MSPIRTVFLATSGQTSTKAGPLRHGTTGEMRTKTGATRRALCGAGVYIEPGGPDFDPAHPRACPKCRRALEGGA